MRLFQPDISCLTVLYVTIMRPFACKPEIDIKAKRFEIRSNAVPATGHMVSEIGTGA